jgi:hypothetical protein
MNDAPALPKAPSRKRGRRVVVAAGIAVAALLLLGVGLAERRIDVDPDVLLKPLEEMPPAGFHPVSRGHSDSEEAFIWRLEFDPVRDDYGFLMVDVGVAPPGRTYHVSGCEWLARQPPDTSEPLAAPVSGGGSQACRFAFPGEWRVVTYQVVTRNAVVLAQVSVAPHGDDAAALELIVSVARRQMDIIERLAPRRWL